MHTNVFFSFSFIVFRHHNHTVTNSLELHYWFECVIKFMSMLGLQCADPKKEEETEEEEAEDDKTR